MPVDKQSFKTSYRANIVRIVADSTSETGYKAIPLPFGIALELSPEQRKKQAKESLTFMDLLCGVAKDLPAGTTKELNPVIGGLTIQIRHSKEYEEPVATQEDVEAFKAMFS